MLTTTLELVGWRTPQHPNRCIPLFRTWHTYAGIGFAIAIVAVLAAVL
jgi:hypothetical protein